MHIIQNGYSQNANGEYFNPWTDEYDSDYDPHNDPNYQQEDNNVPEENSNQSLNEGENEPEPDNNNTPEPTNNNMPEEDSAPIQRQPRPVREISKARKFARGVRAEAARSVRNKVGSTKGTKVAKYVAGKALKGGLRAALAGIGAGVAGITTLAATGSLSKAAAATAAGAAVGNNVGKGISGAVSKVGKTAGRYYQAGSSAVRSEDATRKKAKSKYMQDQKRRDYVRQQLQQASGGQIPSKKEIDKELEKQWEYREAGIKDQNIIDGGRRVAKEKEAQYLDKTYTNEQKENYNDVEQKMQENAKGNDRYQKAYEQLQKNEITDDYFNAEFGEGEAEKAREHQSMESAVARQRRKFESQALFSASIANEVSKSDLQDSKKVDNMRESYTNDYMLECKALNKPMTRERAERTVEEAINDAARIKGIKSGANFPSKERTPVKEKKQPTQKQTKPTQQQTTSANTGSNHVDSTQPNPHTGPGSTPTPSNHT